MDQAVIKRDDHNIVKLVLTGSTFDQQPVCWQHMVMAMSHTGCASDLWNLIHKELAIYNLTFEHQQDGNGLLVRYGGGTVMGKREDLSAWMLAYG